MSNDPINVNRFQNKVRALFGMRGGNPVPTLKDILPTVVLEDDRPEAAFGGGEMLLCGFAVNLAVVAEQSAVLLRNPPGSGVIDVVSYVVNTASGTDISVWFGNNDPDIIAPPWSSVQGAPRDSRFLGGVTGLAFSAALIQRAGTLTAAEVTTLTAGAVQIDRIGQSSASLIPRRNYVIRPGYYLLLLGVLANFEVRNQWQGYERPQERGLPS